MKEIYVTAWIAGIILAVYYSIAGILYLIIRSKFQAQERRLREAERSFAQSFIEEFDKVTTVPEVRPGDKDGRSDEDLPRL